MWKLFPLVSLRVASRRNCKRLVPIILSPPSTTSDSETPWIVRPKIGSVDSHGKLVLLTRAQAHPPEQVRAAKLITYHWLQPMVILKVSLVLKQNKYDTITDHFFLQFGCWECRVSNAWLSCVDWGYFLGPSSQVDCPSKCADDMSPRCCCRLADWQD